VRGARALAAGLAVLTLLAGCASVPPAVPAPPTPTPAQPTAEPITGRLALQVEAHADQPARHYGSAFELHGDAQAGALMLSSPLGTTLAQAQWQPGEVRLATTEGERRHADLDTMVRELFGEALPLAALFDWLRGRPWSGAPSEATVTGFDQLGWRVDTARHTEGWVLLRRAQPPAVSVRVRLDGPR